MAQPVRGCPDGISKYSSKEMGRAGRIIKNSIARGPLHFLQTTFEIYPLEAVPNVWEGDRGLMEHVPPFPMPPSIALPEQRDAEAHVLTSRVHHFGMSRTVLEAPEDPVEVGKKGRRQQAKKQGKERKFWIQQAKMYESLDTIRQCLIKVASRFTNHLESVWKKAAIQLAEVYGRMKRIKTSLNTAEVEYSKNEYSNLFQKMSLSEKIFLKRQNHLQGEFPDNMQSVKKKFLVVRDKMGLIVRRNWEKLSPFKDIMNAVMKDFHTKSNLFRVGVFQCLDADANDDGTDKHLVAGDNAKDIILHSDEELIGGEKSKKIETENVGFSESSYVLSKEDRFWKNMMDLKIRLQKTASILKHLDKINIQSTSIRIISKMGSAICRQMLSSRRNIMAYDETLVQLKKDMETENYEDKKLFTEEDLACLGIKDLISDNSMAVVEAGLQKLKDEYLKIRGEKSVILERFGYDVKIGFENPCVDKNMKLVRICEHSKSVINPYNLDRVKKNPSKTKPGNHKVSTDDVHNQSKTGEGGDEATSSLNAGAVNQQNAKTGRVHHNKNPIVRETVTGSKLVNADANTSEDLSYATNTADEHDTYDESSAEDISKTVNSMSFFLSNFGSTALTVNEQSSQPVSDDFTEREKQYWDKLQKLLRKVDNTVRRLTAKSKQRFYGQKHVKSAMQPVYFQLKGLLKAHELHSDEGRRCGYCSHVTYENEDQLPDGYDYILVKSLDQIKARIDTAYGCYKATAKKVGMRFSFKL